MPNANSCRLLLLAVGAGLLLAFVRLDAGAPASKPVGAREMVGRGTGPRAWTAW